MSSRELGNVYTIYVLGATATALAMASLQSWSESRTSPSIKSISIGDTHMQADGGPVDVTGTTECLYVHTDSAQQRLITMQNTKAKVTLVKYRGGVTYQSASAVITNLDLQHSQNENATFSASFDLDGGWTPSV
jgi:hypothetical protein